MSPRAYATPSRPAPANLEAERAVLGAILLDPAILPRAIAVLTAGDFYKDAHREIYAVMLRLIARDQPADVLTVTEELKRAGKLEEIGGQPALATLMEEATVNTQFASYTQIVRDKAQLRELILVAHEIAERGFEDGADVATLVTRGLGVFTRLHESTRNGHGRPHPYWDAAEPVADLVTSAEPELDWLHKPLLAAGCITEIFSPRGIGKTLVAHAMAVDLARQGKRGLLLDRDNPRSVTKHRLRRWGGGDARALKALTREKVPPLTDASAWAAFPYQQYDFVIIDSLDATTEGVGEQDSAKPSKAIAPLLDLAHREHGPAALILANTIKSGSHGRGSGVIEDRADIVYEVRDATDLQPTGKKPWWCELPDAGRAAWAERATRRKRRTRYLLAFVPTKFRVGEEPEPFVLEVDLSTDPWSMRDVTAAIVEAADQAQAVTERERQARRDEAAQALAAEVATRHTANDPMHTGQAETFLRERGLTQKVARQLLRERAGVAWRTEVLLDRQGQPHVLLPVSVTAPPAGQSGAPKTEILESQSPPQKRPGEEPVSVARMDTGQRKEVLIKPASTAGIREGGLFPSLGSETAPASSGNEKPHPLRLAAGSPDDGRKPGDEPPPIHAEGCDCPTCIPPGTDPAAEADWDEI